MRRLSITIVLLFVLTGCGSDDPQTLTGEAPAGTGATTTPLTSPVSGDDEILAFLEGTWLPASSSKFCPVGMAIGPDGATTKSPPPDDILDLSTIDEVTFTAQDVTLMSSCGEISTFAGTFTRCVGGWHIVDAVPSGDGWVGTLQTDDLTCEPQERVLPALAMSLSSESLELGDIALRR